MVVDGNPALNKLRWGHSGREIAVGDSDGRVLVYEVGEVRLFDFFYTCMEVAFPVRNLHRQFESCLFCAIPPPQQVAVPRNDEWTRFVRTLAEINENRDDAEELAAQRLAA